jgi:hypothetical protein
MNAASRKYAPLVQRSLSEADRLEEKARHAWKGPDDELEANTQVVTSVFTKFLPSVLSGARPSEAKALSDSSTALAYMISRHGLADAWGRQEDDKVKRARGLLFGVTVMTGRVMRASVADFARNRLPLDVINAFISSEIGSAERALNLAQLPPDDLEKWLKLPEQSGREPDTTST